MQEVIYLNISAFKKQKKKKGRIRGTCSGAQMSSSPAAVLSDEAWP